MGEVKWTTEQLQAIESKGSNILVAAAAGSGKTAVLVERIIHKMIDDKIDIDKMLVVTFTNAAAAEMRERILEAIYQKLEQDPSNEHLQKQITLLNKASICTIHSFCLDVIRNHFYEIDLPSNFRIADTTEIDLLKQEVLEDLLEQKYIDQDSDFLELLEIYTGYRGDEPLQELVLSIYRFIQSSPFPEKWLQEKVEQFHVDSSLEFGQTSLGKVILEEIQDELEGSLLKLRKVQKELEKLSECSKFYQVISEDILQIEEVLTGRNDWTNEDKIETSWNEVYQKVHQISFRKWPIDKKVTLDIKEEAKEIRDRVKKDIKEKVVGLISSTSEEIVEDSTTLYPTLQKLTKLVLEFSENFKEKKKEKNCIDFNDIEHLALKLLLDEEGNKTQVSKKYEEKFEEIAIDEYQDSNLVQEAILTSISKGNNIFMVGDVKQSIYKFRQARPELFLEKYASYRTKEDKREEDNLKIQLFRNFRSRTNILDITNLVFEAVMSEKLGDIDYNENEYLNYGANYPEIIENTTKERAEDRSCDENRKQYAGIAELNVIDMKEDDIITAVIGEEEEEENSERIEDDVLEARFVAKRIKELLQSDYQVYDRKKGYRHIEPKDIVILLRATSTLAPIYEKELSDYDLPVFSDSSISYLESVEVETILSVLKLINNPMQDIPLVVVLRSSIGQMTDNELITIRLTDRNCNFYEALIKTRISCEEPLKSKIEAILEKLEKWREQSEYLPLDELIWQIYLDTGYYHYVGLLPNGEMRQANLKTLFEKAKQYETASFKGLFHFIQFIEKLKKQNGDLGSAKLIGESANVIRIMSIHKSKGLEFPVVFLSHTHKKFNLRDLNEVILMHQDLGLGPTLIDTTKKLKYTTTAKQAISLKVKQETLSEEERILYVALTRAKEKLIITGRSKDLQKALQEKEKNLSIYGDCSEGDDIKIDYKLMKKCNSYLDWLEYVYLFHQGKTITLKGEKLELSDIITLNTFSKPDLIKELQVIEEKQQTDITKLIQEEVEKQKETELSKLKQSLEWEYAYEVDTKLPTKTSVTKLKQEQANELPSLDSQVNWEEGEESFDMEPEGVLGEKEQLGNRENGNTEKNQGSNQMKYLQVKPLESEEITNLTPAQKGTLIHLCIQKLDEKKEYELQDIQNLIQELEQKEIITSIEAEAIDVDLVYSYTKSELFQKLKKAKEIYKEQPFYINIPAKEIFREAKEIGSEKNILVQGMIDLYYIDEQDQVHLVDFKTDYVPKGKEKQVADKYQVQIDIYRKALEEALGKKVVSAEICLANCEWQSVSLGTHVS